MRCITESLEDEISYPMVRLNCDEISYSTVNGDASLVDFLNFPTMICLVFSILLFRAPYNYLHFLSTSIVCLPNLFPSFLHLLNQSPGQA